MIPTFTAYINEELNPSQQAAASSWSTKSVNPHSGLEGAHTAAEHISHHVIPVGQHRQTIALEDPHDGHVAAPDHISKHLESSGFKVKDYRSGIATDKHGRDTKIGKALVASKAPKHYVDDFNSDPARSAGRLHNNLQVVISRHPHDVAGMSTDRQWTSCMDLHGGSNSHRVRDDVTHGTHVAYLTQKGDHEAKNPVARIALKPFHGTTPSGESHTILHPEGVHYGNAGDSFSHTIAKWTKTNFPAKDMTAYHKDSKLYHDSGSDVVADWSKFKDASASQIHALPHETKHALTTKLGAHEPTMNKLMADPDHTVRNRVAKRFDTSDMNQKIHEHLSNDPHPEVRTTVAEHTSQPHLMRKLFNTDINHDAKSSMLKHTQDPELRKSLVNSHGMNSDLAIDYISHSNYSLKNGFNDSAAHHETHMAIASHPNPDIAGMAGLSHHAPAAKHVADNHPNPAIKNMAQATHNRLTREQ